MTSEYISIQQHLEVLSRHSADLAEIGTMIGTLEPHLADHRFDLNYAREERDTAQKEVERSLAELQELKEKEAQLQGKKRQLGSPEAIGGASMPSHLDKRQRQF